MTDRFTTAATAEARRESPLYDNEVLSYGVRMAVWARDHLAAQEPTDAECVAVLDVKYGGTVGPHDEPYDAEEMAEARAALTAARKDRA